MMPPWVVVLVVAGVFVLIAAVVVVVRLARPYVEAAERRQQELARSTEADPWSRRGPQYRASLENRDTPPWLRNARGLPPAHDENRYHD